MAFSSSITLSAAPIIPSIFKPKPGRILQFQPFLSAIYFSNTQSSRKAIHFHNPCRGIAQKRTRFWRSNATSGEVLPTVSTPLETSQDVVSSSGDASIISVLFFVAFVVLSILTIGVIYIGVTDFLQKREREKFEKEETAKKKKGRKKVKARPRAGPRGFGQKIDDEYDDEED